MSVDEAAAAPAPAGAADELRERFVSASDGLALFVRDYTSDAAGDALPLVCLPGLTRDGRDFEALARHFSMRARTRRRVVAIDFRGRGRSAHDRNPSNYSIGRELQDVLDVMTALEIAEAIFVGTSRGGLVTMQMAPARPTVIAGAVLNDVGPEIGGRGLLKIKNALERTRAPRDWSEAAALLREAYGSQFPRRSEADWADFARRTYLDHGGRPVPSYDREILKALQRVDFSARLPDMWPQFEGLSETPLLVLRGAHSDLLTAQTLEAMKSRHQAMQSHVVPDAGHVPSLGTDAELEAIERFCDGIDGEG